MPLYYRLANPVVTSISVDGAEYRVNEDGLLEITMKTPALEAMLEHHGAVETDPQTFKQQRLEQAAEEDEKEQLFTWLDDAYGRRLDRRRSLPQLKKMWSDYQAKQGQRQLTGPGSALDLDPAQDPEQLADV